MEIEPGNVIMQFGRVGTDTFTMDFRWVVDIDKPVFMANIFGSNRTSRSHDVCP